MEPARAASPEHPPKPKGIMAKKIQAVNDLESLTVGRPKSDSLNSGRPLSIDINPRGLMMHCYYEGCRKTAVYPCIAVGCCKNYGCTRGICEDHCSKKIVQFDRYGKPPKFCTNCEKRVTNSMWINTCVPFGVFLILIICLVIVLTVHYAQPNEESVPVVTEANP